CSGAGSESDSGKACHLQQQTGARNSSRRFASRPQPRQNDDAGSSFRDGLAWHFRGLELSGALVLPGRKRIKSSTLPCWRKPFPAGSEAEPAIEARFEQMKEPELRSKMYFLTKWCYRMNLQ